jgi:hypothetical protein
MSEYNAKNLGDSTEFSTTPGKVPYPIVVIAIPGALLVLIGFAAGFLWGILCAGFVCGAMYLLMHSKQATLHRAPAVFHVNKNGVEKTGAQIPKEAIHRVIMRNHVLDAASGIIVVPSTVNNAGQNNAVAGMNWAIKVLGPISWRVDVEARGVPTTLAGGLTEPVASAILADVSKALELTK